MVETYPGGQLTGRTCINTYDAANRLTKESIVSGGNTVDTIYAYDNAHNRVSRIIDANGNGVYTDAGDSIMRYVYGNSLNQIEYAYEDANNNLSWQSGEARTDYTYDNNGNRISKSNASGPDTLYYYDRENRLIELVTDTEHDINIYAGENSSGTPLAIANYSTSGTQSRYLYAYDYRTRRVLRDESGAGGEKAYIVFSGGTSIQEYEEDTTANIPGFDSADNLLAEYIRGSDYGGGVGGILYSLRSSVPSYYHYNGRGDVTAKTDSASAITYQAAYEAFGKHGDTASSESWGTNVDRQQANTKDEDPTGLLNEGFRYRDLETGTFITRDPLGFVDGPNVYTYVMQNPWTKFDPLGLMAREGNDGYKIQDYETDNAGNRVKRKPHHKAPVHTWKKHNFSHDLQKHLDTARAGVPGVNHGASAHGEYNKRVGEVIQDFVNSKGIDPSGISGKEAKKYAQELVDQIDNATDGYVRGFNKLVDAGASQNELKNWGKEFRRAEASAVTAAKAAGGKASRPGKLVRIMQGGGKVLKVVAIGTFVYYVSDGGVAYAVEQTARDAVFANEIKWMGENMVDRPLMNFIENKQSNYMGVTRNLPPGIPNPYVGKKKLD